MAIETTMKAYKCETCRKIYIDKYSADICCKQYHCSVCGIELPKFWTICDSCREKRHFDKAIKISIKEYEEKFNGNMVYYDDYYYYDVLDMLDTLSNRYEKLPSYCFGTDAVKSELTDSVLEDIIEDSCEVGELSDEAYREFNEFAKVWNEKYGLKYFVPNNYAVLIPDELLAKYMSK